VLRTVSLRLNRAREFAVRLAGGEENWWRWCHKPTEYLSGTPNAGSLCSPRTPRVASNKVAGDKVIVAGSRVLSYSLQISLHFLEMQQRALLWPSTVHERMQEIVYKGRFVVKPVLCLCKCVYNAVRFKTPII
jgi:hypothetical protein